MSTIAITNCCVLSAGYDLEQLEAPLRRRMAWVKKNVPAREQLAGTVAVEHLTAVLAEKALGDHGLFADADPAMVALWQWHAVEEMEHKAVAFDVYRAIGGTEKMRRAAMRRSTVLLAWDILHGVRHILKKDGKLWSPKVWFSGVRFLFGRQGFLRGTLASYRALFPGRFSSLAAGHQRLDYAVGIAAAISVQLCAWRRVISVIFKRR